MAEGFHAKPTPLIFEGNVAENWRRFKQKFEIYIVASGYEKKTKKEKTCILLNLAGEQAIETYNTFTYIEGESEETIDVVIKKFEEHCNPKRNVSQGSVETIDAFVKAGFHCSRFARAGGAGFENLLTRA
jgi:type I restriction-modification system DNA methylase subunit